MFFDATLATAVMTLKERRTADKPGRAAHRFLSYISEEALLQLAMMADASDEHMGLLRFHDTESFDEAVSPQQVALFLDRARFLFAEKACLKTGYTRVMLKMLQSPRAFRIDGQLKTIGGERRSLHADGIIVTRCLNRMKNWVYLAKLTLDAEFPTFAISHAFEIFNLQPYVSGVLSLRRVADAATPDSRKERAFKVFENTLGLDRTVLEEEFEKHLPAAIRHMSQGTCTNFEAWKRVSESQAKKTAAACTMRALRQALMRYGAFGGSTSGVEQTFAKQVQIAPPSRAELSEGRANDELSLLSTEACDDEALVPRAREIWAELYGSARTPVRELRCDAGAQKALKRCRSSGAITEAGFLRSRRQEVSELLLQVSEGAEVSELQVSERADGWTSGHEAEMRFQKRKLEKKTLEALREKTLDVNDVDADVAARLAASLEEESKTDDQYFMELRRREKALTRKTAPDFKNMLIYVGVLDPENEAELGVAIRANRLRTTTDRIKAEIIVVEDPAVPGQRNLWVAMVKGILLATPTYVKTLGKQGTALKFKGQICRRRSVWASDRFKDKHPMIFNLLRALSQQPACKWRWSDNKEDFLSMAGKRALSNNNAEMLALVTPDEQRSPDPHRTHCSVRAHACRLQYTRCRMSGYA